MRWGRAHSRLAVLLGICAVAGVGVVAGFVVASGEGDSSARPTTGQYAPIRVHRQRVGSFAGALSGDLEAGAQTDLNTMLTTLPGRHHYAVTVSNTSDVGLIESLQWYPPTGVRIVKVLGGSVGHCELTGVTGFGGNQFKSVVLYPTIECDRVDLKPPTCTCLGDGGAVTISFVTDRDMPASGVARMISAKVALRPIPSFLKTKASPQDLSTMTG